MANGLPTSTISHTGQTYLPPLQHDIREYIGGISNPALSILYPDSHQIPDGLVVTQEVVQVGSGGGVGWGGGADLFAWGHTACRFIIPCKCITTRSIKMSWYWLAHEFSSVCEIMKKASDSLQWPIPSTELCWHLQQSLWNIREELIVLIWVQHSMLMHIHKDKTDNIELADIAEEFIEERNEKKRRSKFRNSLNCKIPSNHNSDIKTLIGIRFSNGALPPSHPLLSNFHHSWSEQCYSWLLHSSLFSWKSSHGWSKSSMELVDTFLLLSKHTSYTACMFSFM